MVASLQAFEFGLKNFINFLFQELYCEMPFLCKIKVMLFGQETVRVVGIYIAWHYILTVNIYIG